MKPMNDKETLFRQKADKYLCCFNSHCPRHDQCLRYETGQYYDPHRHTANTISPLYDKAADGSCEYFCDNQPVTMPVGMKQHFYYDMPSRIERQVKSALISHFGRTLYYSYHGGRRPIPPQVLATIESVCQQAGWTQPLQFDGQEEAYLW